MDSATVIDGYSITHPHDPYEDVVVVQINRFAGDDKPWQAQIYHDGNLVEADYFDTEVEALRWSVREVTLMACCALTTET